MFYTAEVLHIDESAIYGETSQSKQLVSELCKAVG
jgi:RAB protein geranylgeranyltransferase component A